MSLLKQTSAEVKADETGSTRDKNSHTFLPKKKNEDCKPINNARRQLFQKSAHIFFCAI